MRNVSYSVWHTPTAIQSQASRIMSYKPVGFVELGYQYWIELDILPSGGILVRHREGAYLAVRLQASQLVFSIDDWYDCWCGVQQLDI